MGIFDKLTGKPVTLTPKSALVLSAITVIAADGVIDDAELNDLAKIVRGTKNPLMLRWKSCGQTSSRLS